MFKTHHFNLAIYDAVSGKRRWEFEGSIKLDKTTKVGDLVCTTDCGRNHYSSCTAKIIYIIDSKPNKTIIAILEN